jgi:hypothetical protein
MHRNAEVNLSDLPSQQLGRTGKVGDDGDWCGASQDFPSKRSSALGLSADQCD